jgi:hypothetical protein
MQNPADAMKSMLRPLIDNTLTSKGALTDQSLDTLDKEVQFYLKQNPTTEQCKQLAGELRTRAEQELGNGNISAGIGLSDLVKRAELGQTLATK